ncbi:hypothetical protein WA026_016338 [Henosepilachna vigintioctopunctata]|uniref:Uncharacterized protein n=1 Tax=Henosepilachna vigintioctopunctata TaxID=420089 RepID=A0AAW1ULX2_9CUCU
MQLIVAKCLSALLLVSVRFSVVSVPLYLHLIIYKKCDKRAETLMSARNRQRFNFHMAILHSFGAGVMLCTCLVHLVTSVHSAMWQEFHLDIGINSQYSQLLICAGFFMIYFLEEIGQWIITKVPSKPLFENKEYSKSISSTGQSVICSISDNLLEHQNLSQYRYRQRSL